MLRREVGQLHGVGLSDIVDWQAQFAGQGFRYPSAVSDGVLWSHFGGEERAVAVWAWL